MIGIYDLSTGEFVQVFSGKAEAPTFDASKYGTKAANDIKISTHKVDVDTGKVVIKGEPAASWRQIKDHRNALRESPITLSDGRTFDANQDSFTLFSESIAEFDNLPSEALDEDGKLLWKMSDNNYTPCSKQDLIDILAELKTARAVRAALLQIKAEQLAQDPPNAGALAELATWGL